MMRAFLLFLAPWAFCWIVVTLGILYTDTHCHSSTSDSKPSAICTTFLHLSQTKPPRSRAARPKGKKSRQQQHHQSDQQRKKVKRHKPLEPKRQLNTTEITRISEPWNTTNENFVKGGAWHQHPLVVATYKHRLASGSRNWPAHLREKYGIQRKCISVGCGEGGIEKELVDANVCTYMQGINPSSDIIQRAKTGIPASLRGKVEFLVQNAETGDLANSQETFDMVLFTHSLHRVVHLEFMALSLQKIMTHQSILVLEEYVGPPRWQFSPLHRAKMAEFLARMEQKYPSFVPVLRQNTLWTGTEFHAPDAAATEAADPTLTVRSDEIIRVLSQHFQLVENVALGGNFFQWIFHNAYNALQSSDGMKIVREMLEEEINLVRNKELQSDYVYQVWMKK